MYLRHPRKSSTVYSVGQKNGKSYIDVTSEEDFQDGDKYTTVQAFASVVSAESEVLCV